MTANALPDAAFPYQVDVDMAPPRLTDGHIRRLVLLLNARGYSDDVVRSEGVSAPATSMQFAEEVVFVICNSGMKNTIARQIYERILNLALYRGESASTQFGHAGKCSAIDDVWNNRDVYFWRYLEADDKLAFLESLPWIGPVTKYHLAKNFGIDCAKPDVHLQRLAAQYETDTHALCARLAVECGLRIATVDLVLWRACALGLIDSRTGKWHCSSAEFLYG